MEIIKSNNLSYSYSNELQITFPDLSIKRGEHLLILGKSGCGKTTLLHLLAGIRQPSTGNIAIDNVVINNLGSRAIDAFRGANIGLIFQVGHFISALTVKENLVLTQKLSGKGVNETVIDALLGDLEIDGKADQLVKNLSVGQQQRVSIARALVNEPKVIFADEPTSALDDENCKSVLELLLKQAEKHGATLIVVTHDKRLIDNFDLKIEL